MPGSASAWDQPDHTEGVEERAKVLRNLSVHVVYVLTVRITSAAGPFLKIVSLPEGSVYVHLRNFKRR